MSTTIRRHFPDSTVQPEAFKQFRQELGNALSHARDPDYQPDELLVRVLRLDQPSRPEQVQAAITQLVSGLEPATGVPAGSRAWQEYAALYDRAVLGLTQEETASRLFMSVRSLQRLQRRALHVLATRVWERYAQPVEAGDDWMAQTKQELAALQTHAPGAISEVQDILSDVLGLEAALAASHQIDLKCKASKHSLKAAIHPSALRQVLVTVLGCLFAHMAGGQIVVDASEDDRIVRVSVTAKPFPEGCPLEVSFVEQVLASAGGGCAIDEAPGQLRLDLAIPVPGELVVLIVDDNEDMVYYLQRCTDGTCYRVVHTSQGRQAFDMVQAERPDVIVLDVMLPDIDGWELLTDLHQNPDTAAIPVVVCSVVREQELALALGASVFLPKPVQPAQFLEALDLAVNPN